MFCPPLTTVTTATPLGNVAATASQSTFSGSLTPTVTFTCILFESRFNDLKILKVECLNASSTARFAALV